jgi:hypothetical protein
MSAVGMTALSEQNGQRQITPPAVRNDDEAHQLGQSERCVPICSAESDASPGRPYLGTDAIESRDTSRQSNTHSIEAREVRYPWHPWYGRTVWIYQSLKKHGDGILRCRIEQDQSVSLQELPEWMFDTAAGQIQIAKAPAVGCEALRDLKALLQGIQTRSGRDSVVEIQHQSLQSSGGADVQAAETSQVYPTPTIPSKVQEPAVAGLTSGNSTEHRENAGTAVAPTFQKSARLQRRKGGTW